MLDDLVDNPEQFDAWFTSKKAEFEKGAGDFKTVDMHLDYAFEGRDTQNYRELVFALPSKFKKVDLDYKHMHFPDIANPVAHVRLADIDQTEDAFTKTLLVDEIQSDAQQEGKKLGYMTKEKTQQRANKAEELESRRQEIVNSTLSEEEKNNRLEALLDEASEQGMTSDGGVPDLPFKSEKRWALQGLRKAMMTAAEEGYDQVALTTGRMQAERNAKDVDAGEGKKFLDFYDKTLMKLWKNNFAKKYDTEIKMVEYKQNEETIKLPTLVITKEMREDILKGLPMFAEGGYVIQKGDTLSQIARDEGMTIAEIAKLNNIQDVNKIYAGQTLTFGQDMSTDISNKAEIIKESEPVIESKQDVFEGVPEKISDITSSIAEKSDVVIDTVESTADKLSDVSKDVQSTISETFDDVKETVSGATGRTLSALKKLVGSDFSSRGRTAENTTGATAAPKPTSIMGDMTMEQVREANTSDAPDLSDVKMPDVDFSSKGRTAENTAGTTEEPKEIKLPAIEFKPKDIEIESEKQMEDQESLVDTLKGFYNASQSQVAKNLIAFFNPLAGDKTEDDYNPQVVDALGFAAANALKKNKSTIDYGDYNLKESNVRAQVGSAAQRKRDNLEARMKSGDITPTEEAAFSVGGGGVTVEGDKVYVTDTYDFSKLERQINSVLPDDYARLRDWISNYKGNEFKSKIFVGTLKDLGL